MFDLDVFDLDPAAPNILPSRYRQVALSTDVGDLDPRALEEHFAGREAYLRTRSWSRATRPAPRWWR